MLCNGVVRLARVEGSRFQQALLRVVVAVMLPALLSGTVLGQNTYYVSPTGSDSANGLTLGTAWQTCSQVNSKAFSPGDTILFERGGEWRESLLASSSGAAGNPITYGAYGSGEKPTFWGSDVLTNGSFQYVSGTTSTYRIGYSQTVNWTFVDGQFYHSSSLKTGAIADPNNDPTTNLNYVNSNAGSWYYHPTEQALYVNTGGSNPGTDGKLYTGAVRAGLEQGAVYSNYKHHLVFQDMIVGETAHWNGGYCLRVQGSTDVRVENVDAVRGGKHHIGVINATEFVAENCSATGGMPDTWFGAASAYVSYSDGSRSGDTSYWKDCVVEHYAEGEAGGFGAFYTHGSGMGQITLDNLQSISNGGWVGVPTEGAGETILITGGIIENSSVSVGWGTGVTIDGITMTGANAKIELGGYGNVVQNVLVTGSSQTGAIQDNGTGNTVRFNTIVMNGGTAIRLLAGANGSNVYGNLLTGTSKAFYLDVALAKFASDYNFFNGNMTFRLSDGTTVSLANWQTAGMDPNGVSGIADFVNAPGGDYTPTATCLAVDLVDLDPNLVGVLLDFLRNPRLQGAAYDAGAFERVPEPASVTLLCIGAVALLRRTRRNRR